MSPFQRTYIIQCLDYMAKILNDPALLAKARDHYNANSSDPRYTSNCAIPNGLTWKPDEITRINAALFEAIFQVNTSLHTSQKPVADQDLKQIQGAIDLLKTQIIQKITVHCTSEKPLETVKKNIPKVKTSLKNEGNENNPYLFFTAVGIATAVAATYYLKQQ